MHKPVIQSLYHTFADTTQELVGTTLTSPYVDFETLYMDETDRFLRFTEWATVQAVHPKAVSADRGLRFLYDSHDPVHPRFGLTDFATYVAVSRVSEKDISLFSSLV